MSKTKLYTSIIIVFLILLFDQSLKIWVKTNMVYGEQRSILGDWFVLRFTENRGMAFGIEFGGKTGKIILSIFRIIAVSAIAWYLIHLIKKNATTGAIICVSMIFAGAIGNIIDNVFYGVLFSESYNQIAEFLPANGGYASLFHGRVVDMLCLNARFPAWVPFFKYKLIFPPIFNIADSSITIGIIIIILFKSKIKLFTKN